MSTKSNLNFWAIVITVVAIITAVCIISARGDNYSTIIWYTPHPDDETLFMGGAIHKAVRSGKKNILVLLTKGGSSAVIDRINDKLPSNTKLTREEFMQARVNEFFQAADCLGLDHENIIVLDYVDSALNEEDAYRIILDLAKRYPRASHRTVSWHDDHPDHVALGKALCRAYQNGIVADARFFLKFNFAEATNRKLNFLSGEHFRAKKKALDAYGIWEPDRGWYGIGQLSVCEYFKQAYKSRFEFYHFPE